MAEINVTVRGVTDGPTTVTIPFTSANSAAAAQAALFSISNQVAGNTLTQVNYTGNGTVPSVTTPLGGVVATGASTVPLSPFGIGGQYVSAVVGSAAEQSVLVNFGANGAIVASGAGGSTVGGSGTPTVVSGTGGASLGNLGTNTQVFSGDAALKHFAELGLGAFGANVNPSATVWVTTPLKGTATFDDSSGSTTINLDTVASTLSVAHPFGQTLVLLNSGNGQTTINVASAIPGTVTDGDALSFRGTSTVATTVNAAGSSVAGTGNTEWDLMKSGSAFINGDGSNIILFPTGPGVAATLFGGSGTDIDAGGGGFIQGGSAGNNVLFGSTVPGSTTLIGGGSGDVLVQQSSGNTFGTGAGSELLFGLAPGDLYKEDVAGINSATINGFVSGTDSISLSDPAGGSYALLGSSTVAPTSGQIDFDTVAGSGGQTNTQVKFGDGTTWTLTNVTLQSSDFH